MEDKNNLVKYLKNYYSDGIFYSHVSMVKPCGKYLFNREELEKFWSFYTDYIKNPKNKIGIAERNQNYFPVLVDIDIKVEEDEDEIYSEHLYSEDQVKQLIQIYQSVLRNIVDNCEEKHLICCLLEKPIYKVEKNDGLVYLKNGFHLHFPHLFLSKSDQEQHLIPRVIDLLKEHKTFDNLCKELDSTSLLDKNYCNVPWLLYGSVKSEDKEPYKLTKIYNIECEEISKEEAFRNYAIYDNRERLIKIEGDIEQYLPRIFSIHPYNRETCELKYGLPSPLKEQEKRENKKSNKNTKLSVAQSLQICEKLLPMLAQFRSEDRNEWMAVGWTLYCISEGCQEGLDLWLEFSARDRKNFNEDECTDLWGKMTKRELTLGTLKFYAKSDSPEKYNEYMKELGKKYMKNSLEGSHNDIAKLLFNDYCTEFVCSSIVNKTWYQFVDHIWEEIEEGKFLRDRISDDVVDKYIKMGADFFQEMSGSDENDTKQLQQRITKLQKLISNLKNSSFKSNVMKESADVFYNKYFKTKLNLDPYLIGFKNGIYDLKNNIFRAGRPEDYISKRMPINYVNFSKDDKKVEDIHMFLRKVFPDDSVRRYFMDQASDIFLGGNPQKIVLFWLGHGDNGKSVTQLFFDRMLGEYAIKISTTLLTGKKSATGTASPELARAGDGVRLITLEEPSADEEISIGYLKSMSGNDSYWARDLFEKGKSTREITPLFKIYFIVNKLPRFRGADKATWNRVRVLPFEATFVRPDDEEGCPDTFEEQVKAKRFPMDQNFSSKIPDLVEAFTWCLLEHRKTIKERIEPEKVRMATALYKKQNDFYRRFMEESIIEEADAMLTLLELYENFCSWYKLEGFRNSAPLKDEVKEYFEGVWGEPRPGNKWKGYRMRSLKDDIDSGEAVVLEDSDLVDYSSIPKM